MKISLPWTIARETHLGVPAYSIFEATGLRVAVGLTKADAELICTLVNSPGARNAVAVTVDA